MPAAERIEQVLLDRSFSFDTFIEVLCAYGEEAVEAVVAGTEAIPIPPGGNSWGLRAWIRVQSGGVQLGGDAR